MRQAWVVAYAQCTCELMQWLAEAPHKSPVSRPHLRLDTFHDPGLSQVSTVHKVPLDDLHLGLQHMVGHFTSKLFILAINKPSEFKEQV